MTLRATALERLQTETFDVLVVGGGINGAVSAACLATWGARVALVDRSDFGGLTSQQSSNLIWGGIKYLETYEFGLVRKLCASRNRLLRAYPSVVQEVRFYTAHAADFRHSLAKLFLGTLLYWALGGFFTRPPRLLSPSRIGDEEPVVDLRGADGGFEYSDAYLYDNDARFVWNFVRAAIDHGAAAANYVESLGAERGDDGLWSLRLRDRTTGREWVARARLLVNACGPFVDDHNGRSGQASGHRHVFSKGVHLIVPRITRSHRVLTFFADDGRPFFVIPMGPRTCIGTTDTRVNGPDTRVSGEDRRFVLDNINKRLRLPSPLTEADVVAERCGVRPLVVGGEAGEAVDWLKLSRKHVVEVDPKRAHVSIFGGKLTDCLNVAEEVAAAARALGTPLPGRGRRWYGEPGRDARDAFFLRAERVGLDALTPPTALEPLSRRLWRRYNLAAFAMLDDVVADRRKAETLVEGTDYVRCEIEHMARREMVTKLDDFLRRRSKVALVMRRDELERSPGLREACRIFFGDAADERAREYFAEADAYAAPAGADSPPAGGPGAARSDGPAPPSGGPAARPEPPRLQPGPALARGNGA
ncbi:MAG TPA: FAD-dependent oxidoreductase [Polyangiaceae bacterium]|nr:FAD-dependent oxidoreductase [Polyangiaceae bacterium]